MHSVFRISPLLFLLLLCSSLQAQKALSLEEAILASANNLVPERLNQLQWMPDGSHYAYVIDKDGEPTFVSADVETGSVSMLFTLSDLKTALPDITVKRMPRIQFAKGGSVLFRSGKVFYQFNTVSKSGKRLFEFPEGAEHIAYSNNHDRCAYVKDHNLYVQLAGGQEVQVTSDGGEGIVYGSAVHRYEFGITEGLFWSPDGERLAFYRKDETMVENYPLVNTAAVPAEVNNIKYPMSGRKSHHVTLGVYHVGKAGLNYLKIDGPKDQYLTCVTWAPDSKDIYVAVLNRDQNNLKLNRYNATSGTFEKTVLAEGHEKYVEPEHSLWFLPDNPDEFLWFSERTGYQHLYRYSTDGRMLAAVTSGDWEAQQILGFDYTGNYLFVRGTGQTFNRVKFQDRKRNGLHRFIYMVDFELGGNMMLDSTLGTHSAQLAADGRHILRHFSSIDVPHTTTLHAATGKQLREVHTSENPLKEHTIGSVELFETMSGNDDVLYGRIIKPSDFDPSKKYPMLWYVYGGPHAQLVTNSWLSGAPLWMYWMAEQGYIVATIDNRGSGNRGLEFEQKTFRQLGQLEMIDQKTGIDYMTSKPWIDKDRMAIHGWSYGGFMTINMMQSWPELFQAGVAGGPVCDWSMYEVMYTERYMDTPEANPEGYAQSNLVDKASKLKKPLLVIHGTVDDVVLWQHSQALVKACVDEGVQLDYFIYPGHPHNVRGKDRIHLIQKVFDYVDMRIGD